MLVSPHTASFAGDYWAPVVDLFLENVPRFRRGEPLINLVDKRVATEGPRTLADLPFFASGRYPDRI